MKSLSSTLSRFFPEETFVDTKMKLHVTQPQTCISLQY